MLTRIAFALAISAIVVSAISSYQTFTVQGTTSQVEVEKLLQDVKSLADRLQALEAEVTSLKESKSPGVEARIVEFTLQTASMSDRFAFRGVSGEIEGKENPTLQVKAGNIVRVTLVNGDGVIHDFVVEGLAVATAKVRQIGETTTVTLIASKTGEYFYYCSIPGHRPLGMEGKLVITP